MIMWHHELCIYSVFIPGELFDVCLKKVQNKGIWKIISEAVHLYTVILDRTVMEATGESGTFEMKHT